MSENIKPGSISALSYVNPVPGSPWDTYLSQVDQVMPYLGNLARWGGNAQTSQARIDR